MERIVKGIAEKYNGKDLSVKLGEIFPGDNVPVVAMEDNKPSLLLMQWGFPKWGSTEMIIKARSETAWQKIMFASPLARRRCVIPTTGFFDWETTEGAPQKKTLFNAPDHPMLYIAGIFTENQSHGNDEQTAGRFVILTQAAVTGIGGNHIRTPVMLYKNEIHCWLTDYPFANAVMSRSTVRINRIAA